MCKPAEDNLQFYLFLRLHLFLNDMRKKSKEISVYPEMFLQKIVPPGVVHETFSHQVLSMDSHPEQQPQQPHHLEENIKCGDYAYNPSIWEVEAGRSARL